MLVIPASAAAKGVSAFLRQPHPAMAKDLSRVAPRRWSEEVDGIRWLGRLIDKTRATLAGTLGSYLYGQSPMDRSLLHELGIGHRAFAEIVAAAPDDARVVAALAARDPESIARAHRWSESLPARQRLFLFILDVDDGYVEGPWRALKVPVNIASGALAWAVKRLWPSRVKEGSR